jgi:hypothetical protein
MLGALQDGPDFHEIGEPTVMGAKILKYRSVQTLAAGGDSPGKPRNTLQPDIDRRNRVADMCAPLTVEDAMKALKGTGHDMPGIFYHNCYITDVSHQSTHIASLAILISPQRRSVAGDLRQDFRTSDSSPTDSWTIANVAIGRIVLKKSKFAISLRIRNNKTE